MNVPDDSADVLKALRLGWYLAEVRGRNWPGGPQAPSEALPSQALPLHFERTAVELQEEAETVLHQLSTDLGVDAVTDKNNAPQSRTGIISQQAGQLTEAKAKAKVEAGSAARASAAQLVAASWGSLAELIFEFDAHAQDLLASRSDMQHAAYQLGRGLAETYWALDPKAAVAAKPPQQPDSWLFLLGSERCDELSRLTGRLSAYFSPYCSPAIAGTVRLWESVAGDEEWRKNAQPSLFQQLRRWYELLILGQDPSTLIKPYTLLKNWHTTWNVFKALWIQIVTAAVSLALVITAITLTADDSHSPFVKSLLGVLGLIGLSATTIQARLKSTTQNLVTRIQQDAYTDLVALEIAEIPAGADGKQPKSAAGKRRLAARRRKAATRAVRNRTLTTVPDAPTAA